LIGYFCCRYQKRGVVWLGSLTCWPSVESTMHHRQPLQCEGKYNFLAFNMMNWTENIFFVGLMEIIMRYARLESDHR
jgi:hypothetical protein